MQSQNGQQLVISPSEGFDFSTRRKMQSTPKNFHYDMCLIYAVAGKTRKTGRYDLDMNEFINSELSKIHPRPKTVAIGIKSNTIILDFDNPQWAENNMAVTKNGMVSSKYKLTEIIKSQGLMTPEDEGDELRLYFKFHHMIENMYRAECLQSPKR